MDETFFTLTLIALSVLAAGAPVLLYLAFVWLADFVDREPLGLLLRVFIWGAIASAILSLAGELLVFFASKSLPLSESALPIYLAPMVEEIAKASALFLVFSRYEFDNALDGIVYGVAAGLGFALTENLVYYVTTFLSSGGTEYLTEILYRTAYGASVHALSTAVIGIGLGAAKFAKGAIRPAVLMAAVIAGFLVHSAFNLTQMVQPDAALALLGLVAVAVTYAGVRSLAGDAAIVTDQLKGERDVRPKEVRTAVVLRRRLIALGRVFTRQGLAEALLLDRLFNLEAQLAFHKQHAEQADDARERRTRLRMAEGERKAIRSLRSMLGPTLSRI